MSFSLLDDQSVLLEMAMRLRKARLGLNLTQQQLAQRSGLSLKTISNAEEGRNVSLRTFVALLRALSRLDELNSVLAEELPSPLDLAKRQGRLRERASGDHRATGSSEEWRW